MLNRELGADFALDRFEHVAFFDPEHEWIEMRLRGRRAQTVRIADLDLDVPFDRGEALRAELHEGPPRAPGSGLRGGRPASGGLVHRPAGVVRLSLARPVAP